MGIRIRKGTPSDIDGMATLLSGLFSLETDFVIDGEKQRAGLELFLSGREGNAIFVAEETGALIGMVTCQLVVSTAAGGASVLLEDLYVEGPCRGKGVGSALVTRAMRWGMDHGALRVQLVADGRNGTALAFYRRMGFKESSMTGLYKGL